MKISGKKAVPPVGLRILKSAAAILVCYLISFLRKESGIVFYSQLAALWCIQTYQADTKKNALQRLIGTVIGALYGLLFLLVRDHAFPEKFENQFFDALAISGMIVVVLYTTVLVKKKHASYFSCVVFLSIVVNHLMDVNPYLFVWNRFLDTVIGIFVGLLVNTIALPTEKQTNTLFISELDGVLLDNDQNLSDYAKAELNRMLDDGIQFTISTMRTPASLMKYLQDIRLKLPVVAMDGAVLYDIRENDYLKVYIISKSKSESLLACIREMGYTCFVNCVIDGVLVIYYEDCMNDIQWQLMKKLRSSPYRNYVKMGNAEFQDVVYFMMLHPEKDTEIIYQGLKKLGFTKELKILKYASQDYPGYSYIKIYNKNATRENMKRYLEKLTGVSSTVTFGAIPGESDVVITEKDSNKAVRELKKQYERPKISLRHLSCK